MKLQRACLLCLILGLGMPAVMAQKGLKIGGFFLPQTSFLYNEGDFNLDEDLYEIEFLPSMAGGLQVGYHFNKIIGIRLNVIYSQEGGRYSVRRDFDERDDFTTRLSYIKVPFLIGFNTSPVNSKVQFAMYAGIQGNMLTRASTYFSNPTYLAPSPEGAYRLPATRDLYEQWTYSAVLDLGVDIFLTPNTAFNLRMRGDLGLTDSENKDASYQFASEGQFASAPYWEWQRTARAGANAQPQTETFPLNVGLLFGVTYTVRSADKPVGTAAPAKPSRKEQRAQKRAVKELEDPKPAKEEKSKKGKKKKGKK